MNVWRGKVSKTCFLVLHSTFRIPHSTIDKEQGTVYFGSTLTAEVEERTSFVKLGYKTKNWESVRCRKSNPRF
jgi:hypothetical protein